MKKNKKKIIGFAVVLVIVIIAALVIINLMKDENRLNVFEKQWINNNSNQVQNIGVKNNVNVFGNDGIGVFYDFITDFANEYNLSINPTPYSDNKSTEAIYFRLTTKKSANDLVLYQDHFVLIGKKDIAINSIYDLQNRKVGILNSYLQLISNYSENINNLSFTQYKDKEQLLNEFNEQQNINYILVPLTEYLDTILEDENYINLHLSDIPIYYTVYEKDPKDTFSSIIKKYYNSWKDENFQNAYDKELYDFFCDELEITDEQKDKLHNKTYNYGFIENRPYETLSGSKYGGIINIYLDSFKNFSNTDIKYTRYKNKNNLVRAINKKDIDLYFNFFNINSDFNDVKTLMNLSFVIAIPEYENTVVSNLRSLENKDVYVLEESVLENYLKTLDYLNVKTYKDNKQLKRVAKDNIIILDANNYKYYKNDVLKNHTFRYSGNLNVTYNFSSNASDTFNKLFYNYINILDPKTTTNEGIYNNKIIVQNGTILGRIATYILYIIFAGVIIGFIVYKSTRKIKIAKRIKKEDKMRFIDQLTSLKNRNYLNENIEAWNKNTIYPQTTLIIDLNKVQYINDTYGYEQGDKQIQAAANILIKLQLDNTDIIRTDGTEFMVYFVGHSEKQIASFMRKLNKEFKKLPYDYGVVMAYSTINDDIKLLEDAINEATLAVKEKKNEKDENDDTEKI